jgi:hypothetical protein
LATTTVIHGQLMEATRTRSGPLKVPGRSAAVKIMTELDAHRDTGGTQIVPRNLSDGRYPLPPSVRDRICSHGHGTLASRLRKCSLYGHEARVQPWNSNLRQRNNWHLTQVSPSPTTCRSLGRLNPTENLEPSRLNASGPTRLNHSPPMHGPVVRHPSLAVGAQWEGLCFGFSPILIFSRTTPPSLGASSGDVPSFLPAIPSLLAVKS